MESKQRLAYIESILARHEFLQLCDPKQLHSIAERCELKKLGRREVLFRQGKPSERFVIVISGMVKLSRKISEKTEKVVRFVPPGDAIGEATIFKKGTYPVTATASLPSEVLLVPGEPIIQMMKESWDLTAGVMQLLFIRLNRFVTQVEYLSLSDVKLRFAHFILYQCKAVPGGNNRDLVLSMSRREIANHIATTPETLSRMLKYFRDHKMLVPQGRMGFVVDVPKITSFIESEIEKKEKGESSI